MLVKVFVLGRPGSGKTTAVRHLIELACRRNYFALRMKDYEMLYQMFLNDTNGEKFRATDYEGFDVLDYSVFDTALTMLEQKIQEEKISLEARSPDLNGIITIEFARNDYRKAFQKFSPGFLQDSYFFFVDANMDTCIRRIHQRVTNPPKPDHHFVSDHIMHTYYNVDNWDFMSSAFKQEYTLSKEVVAFRNTASLQTLTEKVSAFAEMIFQREFKEQKQPQTREEQEGNLALDDVKRRLLDMLPTPRTPKYSY